MKTLTLSLFSTVALSLAACDIVNIEDVTAVTQDIVDATADLPVLSLEVESAFEAANVVAPAPLEANGYALLFAITLENQLPKNCITAVATDTTVDVLWDCPGISGTSQTTVALTDLTISFTTTATDLQLGDATVSYQNTLVVDELANEGNLTRNTTITKGTNTFQSTETRAISRDLQTRRLNFSTEIDLNSGEDTLTLTNLVLGRGAAAPLRGEASSEKAFDFFEGGYAARFDVDGELFFVFANNAFRGLGVTTFNFLYEIDTINNNVLLPILSD
jgi:hypothetical protein